MRAFQLTPAWLFGLFVWLGLMAGSYAWLLRYSFAVGKTSVAPRTVPACLGLPTPLPKPQLLLALHPREREGKGWQIETGLICLE